MSFLPIGFSRQAAQRLDMKEVIENLYLDKQHLGLSQKDTFEKTLIAVKC